MREEKTLIDAFNDSPSQKIDETFNNYGSSFYPK